MELIACIKCKEEFTAEGFYKEKRKKNGRTSRCKICMNKEHKEYYKTHTEYEAKRGARRYAEMRDWSDSLKDAPCIDCGNKYPAVCMDWDHVIGEKVLNLSALVRKNNKKRVLEEITKCELVCANCHRIRTSERKQSGGPRKYDRSTWGISA